MIVTDSTCDLPPDTLRSLGVRCVPVTLRNADRRWHDGVDIGAEQVAHLLRRGEVLRSAPVTTEQFQETYRELLTEHDEILSVHVGSGLSCTVGNARLAVAALAQETRGHGQIEVVDAGAPSLPLGVIVEAASRALSSGMTVPEVVSLIYRLRAEQFVEFTVLRLKFLRRVGSIRPSQERLGRLLNVRPVLSYHDGELVVLRTVLPQDAARSIVLSLEATFPFEALHVTVGETSQTGSHVDQLIEQLNASALTIRHLERRALGAVLSANTGPGVYGLSAVPSRLLGQLLGAQADPLP